MKKAKDRAMSTKRDHLEAIKLKEDIIIRLKEGELIKEHSWVANVAAQLDHCKVLCKLAENRA